MKVIDWGLAKAVNADPVLGADQTRDGFVGTPAFASPEQFAPREDRRVDLRSDIYSLGVTLWYLLCGCSPFVGGTLEAIHARQKELPFAQLAAKRVPSCIIDLLKSMLALDPAGRPQSARELLETIQRCQAHLAAGPACTGYRRWLMAGIGMLLILALGIGARRYSSPAMVTAPDCSLAVLPFENLGSDEADALFTTDLQDEIAKDLVHVAALRVVGVSSTRSAALQSSDLSQIGRELGVRHLLTGSVRRQNGQLQVRARLLDVSAPVQRWSAQYDRQLAAAFVVRSEITRAVAARLDLTLSAAEKAAVAESPTSDLTAYDLYLRVHEGRHLFQTDAERGRYDSQIALPLLDEAVARDPKFVLAYCDLAAVHDALIAGQGTMTRAEAVAKDHLEAEAVLAIARRLQPDSGEMHLAWARHFCIGNRRSDEARTELDLARRELPDNVEVESLAGEIAYNQNRWDEAARCFERAAILDPRNIEVQIFLRNLYRSLRRYDDFDVESALIIARLAPKDSVSLRLGRTMGSLDRRANSDPLRNAIDAVALAEQPQPEVMNEYRLVLALCTHDPDAVSSLLAANTQTSIMICGIVYPKAWFVALAARMRHDEAGAYAAFKLAREEVNHELQTDPMDGRTLGLLAMTDAGLGQKDDAIREALHACELCPRETAADQAPIVACNLAVVYAWTGEPDSACAVLEEWIKRPAAFNLPGQPTYGDLRLNPVWNPLRDNPRFCALVARLAPPAPH